MLLRHLEHLFFTVLGSLHYLSFVGYVLVGGIFEIYNLIHKPQLQQVVHCLHLDKLTEIRRCAYVHVERIVHIVKSGIVNNCAGYFFYDGITGFVYRRPSICGQNGARHSFIQYHFAFAVVYAHDIKADSYKVLNQLIHIHALYLQGHCCALLYGYNS